MDRIAKFTDIPATTLNPKGRYLITTMFHPSPFDLIRLRQVIKKYSNSHLNLMIIDGLRTSVHLLKKDGRKVVISSNKETIPMEATLGRIFSFREVMDPMESGDTLVLDFDNPSIDAIIEITPVVRDWVGPDVELRIANSFPIGDQKETSNG